MKHSELEFIPTADLLDELLGRFQCGAIILSRFDSAANVVEIRRQWAGNEHAAVGLAADLISRIIDHIKEQSGALTHPEGAVDTPDDS